MFQTIRLEVEANVATLTLNRPDKLNSFTAAMHEELAEALGEVERDPGIRALLITGAGRGFCAGQDLGERAAVAAGAPVDGGAALERYYNPLVLRLRRLEKPVVCAVNGVAAGAGANFALACDLVLAARSASFIEAFSRIGLVPDCGGTWVLPRLVGPARALGLTLLGERLSAEEAASWGLIWRVVDDAALMTEATALARRLAAGPTRALGLTKRAIDASFGNDLAAQLDLERDLQREAASGEDYREGIAAFLAKRAPEFKGR